MADESRAKKLMTNKRRSMEEPFVRECRRV